MVLILFIVEDKINKKFVLNLVPSFKLSRSKLFFLISICKKYAYRQTHGSRHDQRLTKHTSQQLFKTPFHAPSTHPEKKRE